MGNGESSSSDSQRHDKHIMTPPWPLWREQWRKPKSDEGSHRSGQEKIKFSPEE
jgi:hypothetical protein